MMIYRNTLATVFLLLIATTVMAQVPAETTSALERAGYRVQSTGFEGGLPAWNVRTPDGNPISVSVIGSFTSDRATALDALSEVIFNLNGLTIDRTRVVFERERATAVVVPSRYVIDGEEYSQYMPSGMQFIYEDSVRFDFRMLSDNLALRINGQYLTEQQFRDRLVRAIANPAAFVQSSDPQFLARRLDEQRNSLDLIRASAEQRDRELQEQDEQLQEQDAQLQQEIEDRTAEFTREVAQQVARGEGAYLELVAMIEVLREQLVAEIAALEDSALALAEVNLELRAEFEALRTGSIMLAARTLFGALREVDEDTIEQVVALRAANANLTADEARDQVNAQLGEDAPELHARHVQAIYALYFNQYE